MLGADIAIEDDCRAIAETCVHRYGRIDILHNNVGTLRGDGGSVDLSGERLAASYGYQSQGVVSDL